MSRPCKFCGTEPNLGEAACASEAQAGRCAWMGPTDWKRYKKSAPVLRTAHNSGEGDLAVMSDCAGADTALS
jgi:hypothetical protein